MADNLTIGGATEDQFNEEEFLQQLRALRAPSIQEQEQVPPTQPAPTPLVQAPEISAPSAPSAQQVVPDVQAAPVAPVAPAEEEEDDFMRQFRQDFNLEEQARTFPTKLENYEQINQNFDKIIGMGAVELPPPTTEMYDDLRSEDSFLGFSEPASKKQRQDLARKARERYQAYAQHPEAETTLLGEVRYKGRIVPPYSQDIVTGSMDVGILPVDVGGLGNTAYTAFMGTTQTGPKAIIETGSSLVDAASAYMFNYNPQLTEKAQQIADLDTGDSIVDSIVNEGSGMFVGLGGASAMIDRLRKIAPALSTLTARIGPRAQTMLTSAGDKVAGVAKALGLEAGMAAGTKSDADTLLVGENSMVGELVGAPIIRGITADPDSPEFEQVLAKRLNILTDGLTAGKVVEYGARGSLFMVKLVGTTIGQPARYMISSTAAETQQQDTIVRKILEELIGVDGGQTPQQYAQSVQNIADLVAQGAQIDIKVPYDRVADVNAQVDTMSALVRALEMGDPTKASEIMSAQASAIQRGQLQSGGPQTVRASNQMAKEADRVMRQTEELLGYNPVAPLRGRQMTPLEDFYSIEEMRDFFQQKGMDEVAASKQVVDLIRNEYDALETAIDARVRNDPSMFGRLEQLSEASGVDLYAPSRKSANTIVQRLKIASRLMDNRKDQLFNAVAGGEVDTDELLDALLDTIPESELDNIVVKGDPYYSAMMKQLVGDDFDAIRQNFKDWATTNKLDFGKLYTTIRPSLSYTISNLDNAARQGNIPAGNTRNILLSLRNYIDNDALKHVAATGDKDVADAARKAMDYYKNTWAPYWKDGTEFAAIGELRRKTVDKGIQNDKFSVEARGIVGRLLTEQNQELGNKLVTLLKSAAGGQNASFVTDFIIGDVFRDLAPKVREAKGLSKMDLNEVSARLSPYAALIKDRFPAEAQKIDDLVTFLEDAKAKKPELLERAKAAEVEYQKAEEMVLNSTLSTFFKNSVNAPLSNGFEAMRRVFNDTGRGVAVLQDLKQMAQADDMAIHGMQAAFLRWARDKTFIKTRAVGDTPILSESNTAIMNAGMSNIMDYATILFDDKPEFVNALQTILEETNVIQKSKKAKALPLESPTATLLEQQRRFNSGVTQIMGVLNRWSARVRNVAGAALMKRFDTQRYLAIQDSLLSDPDAFIAAAKKVVDDSNKLDKNWLFNFLTHVGIYREDPDSRREFDAMMEEDDAEATEPSFLESSVDKMRDVGRQTMEMLGL